MDEEVINDLYNRAKSKGYSKTRDEFIDLLHSDNAVFNDMYSYVKNKGYQKDVNSFSALVGKGQPKEAPVQRAVVEKKNQVPPQNTTVSSSEDGSLASQEGKKPYNVNKALVTNTLASDYVMGKLGIDKESPVGKTYGYLNAQASNATSSILESLNNSIDSIKNSLIQSGDEDNEDDTIYDDVKKAILNPVPVVGVIQQAKEVQRLVKKVVNSSLPQETKTQILGKINNMSSSVRKANTTLEEYRKENVPEGVFNNVVGGIVGFLPDIALAATIGSPAASEGKLVTMSKKATEKAIPVVAKYAPKAAAFLERAVAAPMTKIFAAKGGLEGMASADVEAGDNTYIEGIKGAAKGALEGIYMHGLGEVAGLASPTIARVITKTGINNAIASELAMPLANAGVFTTAKALRTPIEEGRLATAEELATEAGTGIGFSLLHIGSQYKNQKELDYYYENVINDNPLSSFSRVINETKENLELAYDPNLTEADIKELEQARAELKAAALKEVDLKVKKTLGDEALKIQNKIDAHNSIKNIVESKDALIESINSNDALDSNQKEYYTRKISAIADSFDTSEYAVSKRELNNKIIESEKELETLSTAFTNLKNPTDRIETKVKIDEKRKEIEQLNNQLTDLITNKPKEDAVQKQTTDEGVLRTEKTVMELQAMVEGNAKPEVVAGETIANEKPKSEVEIPESEKAEYDSRLEMHEENSAMAKKYLEEEKAKGFFSRNKSDVKYFEERIKFHEEKAKLLKENPAEYYRELLKEEQKYYEDEIKGNPEFKQSQIDNYGTTDFNVTNSNVIDRFNRKISAYEDSSKINIEDYSDVKVYKSPDGNFRILGFKDNRLRHYEGLDVSYKTIEEAQKKLNEYIKKNNAEATKTEITTEGQSPLLETPKPAETVEEPIIQDSQIPLKRETFEVELVDGSSASIVVTTNKDGSKKITQKDAEGSIVGSENLSKDNTLTTEDYITKAYGDIKGEPKVEQGNDIMAPAMKEKLTPEQKAELGIEEPKPTGTPDEVSKPIELTVEPKAEPKAEPKVEPKVEPKTPEDFISEADNRSDADVNKLSGPIKVSDKTYVSKDGDTYSVSFPDKRAKDGVSKKLNLTKEQAVKILKREMAKADAVNKAETKKTLESERVKTYEFALKKLQESKEYIEADDIQRENLVRKLRKDSGLTEKAAPSVKRILGKLKDITRVTIDEMKGIHNDIKMRNLGAKEVLQALKEKKQNLIADLKELRKGGKITANQASAIVNRFSKVNLLSETSVSRFTDYMAKVFNNAEYAKELNNAKKTKISISKLSRNKAKDINLRELGKKFIEIDPSMVENIYEYNDIARKIKEAISGSTLKKLGDTVRISEVNEYVEKALEIQNEKIREERIAEIQDLMGVDASNFSAEEMIALLDPKSTISDQKREVIIESAKKGFEVYSTLINEAISKGKDIFTGEDVQFTKAQKDLVKRFMDMDLTKLEPRELIAAVDSLQNFLVNKSTAKMESVVRKYQGEKLVKELVSENMVSRILKKYWNKPLGRQLADKITTLPVLFEKMFPGLSRSQRIMDDMGLTETINEKANAETKSANIVNDYVNKFYKKKANDQDYNTEYNIIERGLAAYMVRSLIGSEQQIQKEFKDRKDVIELSIERLSKGNDAEKYKARLYKIAFDKILKDSNNSKEVLDKTDKNNVDGVNFWIEEYSKQFDKTAEVSEGVYNIKLERDFNYTPNKISRLSSEVKEVELDIDQSSFHGNNGSVIVEKTGSLNKIQRLGKEDFPEGKYVDLSFDRNMSNSMYDLLVDINTAAPIRQIKAFINSPEFNKLVPNAEDRALLKGDGNKIGRIELFIRNARNKNPYSASQDMKYLNKLASIGVGQALAGVVQPVKQIAPIAISTLINTKGKLELGATFNADKLAFIDNSGYGIANRGRKSQAEIESVDKLMEKADQSSGEKAFKYIEKANELQLKYLLEKPDVYIAKASWLTYYQEGLRKQGIDTKSLDYKTHELNKKAADYAQRQVDRQQNISDSDLAGRLYTDRSSYVQVLTKMLMPFSSFRMNASAKFGADLITLQDKTSSKEDKAIARRSIAAYSAEMATFRLISIGSSILLGSLVNKYLGKEESDEDYEKRVDNAVKGAKTSIVTDLVSPMPLLDPFVQMGGAKLTAEIEELTGAPISLYDVPKQEFIKQYGTLGISIDRLGSLWDLGNLAATGKYKDEYGKEKQISEDDMMSLRPLVPIALGTNFGLFPSEVNTSINYAVKFSKKKGQTPEEVEQKEKKIEDLNLIIEEAKNPEQVEAAEKMLDKIENPDDYQEEKRYLKELKAELLVDPETGESYETIADLKKYNKKLWEENFGEKSEWNELTKDEKEVKKIIKDKETAEKDKEYGYVPKKKRKKNSDGTYKSYSSKTRRGFNSGESTSSSKSVSYDSNGLKTTRTSSRRRGFNN